MINWNNNDTKYIIKRIILYLLISGIVFSVGTQCAKAATYTNGFGSTSIHLAPNGSTWSSAGLQNAPAFKNTGQGYAIFNLIQTGGVPTFPISQVTIGINTTFNDSANDIQLLCEIGTTMGYNDSSAQYIIYTAKCPANLNSNNGIVRIYVSRLNNSGDMYIYTSNYITYVTSESEANQIISGQQQAIQQQINNDNTNTQNIMNSIAQQTQNEINAINNSSSQAHQDAQNIINGLQQATATEQATQDYLKEDYQFDQQMINDFGIFGTNTNYLQQILMWPYNLALSLGNALSGTSCSTYSFGYLYGTELKLPCINWKQYVGNSIYVAIDTIMGMCILFGVITFIRKAFEYILNFGSDAYETISVEVFK